MRFLIVTASYNGERFLREALDSVFTQAGDFDVDYRVHDGGSSDGTITILEEYRTRWERKEIGRACRSFHFAYVSGKDDGMYDAINRGFAAGTGDVLAWLNTDDFFAPGAFAMVARTFDILPTVEWLKGITSYVDQDSVRTATGRHFLYDRGRIGRGIYGRDSYFIQQTSVFWRRALWDREGPIPNGLRLAGDYALWLRFARSALLYCVNEELAYFRKVSGQLSENAAAYEAECEQVRPRVRSFGAEYERFISRIGGRFPGIWGRRFERCFLTHQTFAEIRWNSGNPRRVGGP